MNTDYESLPRPAQALYTMTLHLRNQSGLSLDETELVRAAGVWYHTFLVSSNQTPEEELIATLTSLPKYQAQRLARELISIRMPAFIRQPDQQRLLQTRDRRTLVRNKKFIKKKLLGEIGGFFKKLESLKDTASIDMREEDLAELRDYTVSIESISSELRESIFGTIQELKNVSHSIMVLVYAIQTATKLTRVGLATIPGFASLRQENLYEEDRDGIIRYLVYVYAKKGRLHSDKQTLLYTIAKQEDTASFQ